MFSGTRCILLVHYNHRIFVHLI